MNLLLFAFTLGLMLVRIIPTHAEATKWVMPVQKEDFSPFKHRLNGKIGGIEVDLVRAIASKVGIPLQLADYSISDGRKAFLEGKISVDCCLNKVWFPTKKDKAAQLFSKPIYRLIEIWVFPRDKVFPVTTTKDLKNKRVAGIKGFAYPGEEDFGTRINGVDVASVLKILTTGEADIAVLERHAVVSAINKQKANVVFGPPFYTVNVSLRLHKSQEKYLNKVNQTIDNLKASGTIDKIIQRNLK
ncbi:MAG: transporter substrate-binding domain-containing protein [Alphaproteobacteria bacterium]|nr:transporter substrate-binding domain-containing protein [Rhodospirillales bacterium]MCW9045301.1 transporter substrate-binding domain-containing protein [Alphaproteobacteria bacterium]